ncbi:MAG: sulfite exporter TauE/SafE family protein [Eubacterium sp.]|nr:sulfite exporter TauE/SafE family protein [Eubacterium sp.]
MLTVITCIIAGIGAGVATGFAGLSAATVITPLLVGLLGIRTYDAVAIALASDVLASAAAAWNYYKHKNIDLKNGVVMMMFTMLFTLIGSIIAAYLPQVTMGWVSFIITGLMGINFIVRPSPEGRKWSMGDSNSMKQTVISGVCGIYIGLVCGIIGAGGGMMMLMILTIVLGYELKPAVGTSTFIMTFTAGTGAITHFMLGEKPNFTALILCIVFTLIGSWVASKIANKAKPLVLNRVTGIILLLVAISMSIVKYTL